MADAPKLLGMYLQDPSLPDLHVDVDLTATGDVLVGTGSSRFCVRDEVQVDGSAVPPPDGSGLPLFHTLDWAGADLSFAAFDRPEMAGNPQFHQVNVFAVVTDAVGMVEEELGSPLTWRGGGALIVRPHAFEELNAFYAADDVSLNFGYARSAFRPDTVWTCLSHDVVAHELGHAVLDGIRPGYFETFPHPDVAALHESVGDLVAMFSALRHPDLVARMFADSGGDVRNPSVISRLAEDLGVGIFGTGATFLRSAVNDRSYPDADEPDPHIRSLIWTGAIYEIMARLAGTALPPHPTDAEFVAGVVEASRWVRGMLIRALHSTPPGTVTLPQLARLMIAADARVFPDDRAFREIAGDVFSQRGLWDPSIDLAAPDIGGEVRDADDAAALAGVVVRNAAALRVLTGPGVRLLTPTLVTSTRSVDKVKDAEGVAHLKQVVEHYLGYRYEVVARVELPDRTVGVPVQFGGTLVMDEAWNAVGLATFPVVTSDDEKADDPTLAAVTRTVAELGASLAGWVASSGSPLTGRGGGAVGLERRRCDLRAHLRGIARGSRTALPFATTV